MCYEPMLKLLLEESVNESVNNVRSHKGYHVITWLLPQSLELYVCAEAVPFDTRK